MKMFIIKDTYFKAFLKTILVFKWKTNVIIPYLLFYLKCTLLG